MDKNWLLKAVAYVELNPVRAGMVKRAWDYKWSSVHAHLTGEDTRGIIKTREMLNLVGGNWEDYLEEAMSQTDMEFEHHEKTRTKRK